MHFGCSNLMLHSKSPIIRRKAKRKVQSCRTVKWPRGFEIVLNLGKCRLFRWIHTLNLFLLQTYSHLESETQTNLSTLHWWMGKKPLESYWRDYLVTFKGVIQLKPVNETITSKAYQDDIKSDIKLQYESHVNHMWIFKEILQGALSCWMLGVKCIHIRVLHRYWYYPDMPYWWLFHLQA